MLTLNLRAASPTPWVRRGLISVDLESACGQSYYLGEGGLISVDLGSACGQSYPLGEGELTSVDLESACGQSPLPRGEG